jgi:anti-sigma-K factor RskA
VSERFDELVGDIEDPRERERLRRVHDLLLAVEPPPDVSRTAREAPVVAALPRRRRVRPVALLAAALAVAAFGAGYLVGGRDADAERLIEMSGVGAEGDATASIEVLAEDDAGNWPMRVLVSGLEPSSDRRDFYELWLTDDDGKPIASCGRFLVGEGQTNVTLTVPYGLRRYAGWIVTRAGSDEPLLTT